MIDLALLGVPLVIAFVVCYLAVPVLIRSAHKKNILSRDANKPPGRPEVANMGGIILYFAFAGAMLATILLLVFVQKDYQLFTLLLAALASVSILAMVGMFDDMFRISAKLKFLLPVVGALPLIAITAGDTNIALPFIGSIDFGLYYTFLLIPLGVTGAANAVNMSGGYNGLEAGIGAIVSFFLLLIAVNASLVAPAIILASLLGVCLAFLRYNWFPAKVFPADVGTLVIGAAIACAVIIGNMEKFGVIALLPAFYCLYDAVWHGPVKRVPLSLRRDLVQNPHMLPDGKLKAREGAAPYSLASQIISRWPMTEAKLVMTILSLFAISGILALAAYWLKI
ncbi:hypothetical protein HZC09_02520 [Candidatus Micrarchaeota archaeon]|nr:hypothetical protein [Candidatus Micrarchaeota archaeon]